MTDDVLIIETEDGERYAGGIKDFRIDIDYLDLGHNKTRECKEYRFQVGELFKDD